MFARNSIIAILGASFLVITAGASPTSQQLVRRTPSDKSGKLQVALSCESVAIPDPVSGSIDGYFSNNTVFIDSKGGQHGPDSCEYISSTCGNCTFTNPEIKDHIEVQSCWNPIAGQSGCSIAFRYEGYAFDSQNKEPYCGHDSSFQPFSGDLTALCYFNTTGTGS